jgi:hypothetical protein
MATKRRRRRNPLRSPAQYRLARAAAGGYVTGSAMTPAAARKLLRDTSEREKRRLARGRNPGNGKMIPAKVIVDEKTGKVRVFVNPRHLPRLPKYTVVRAFRNGWIVQDERGRSVGPVHSSRKSAVQAMKERKKYDAMMHKAYS